MGSETFAARVRVRSKLFFSDRDSATTGAPRGQMIEVPPSSVERGGSSRAAELTKSEMTLYAMVTHTSPKTKPLTANVNDMLRRCRTYSGHSEHAGLECLDMMILRSRRDSLVPSTAAAATRQARACCPPD